MSINIYRFGWMLVVLAVLASVPSTSLATMEGLRVSIDGRNLFPDRNYSFTVDIEWTTWSEYPDCGADYWVPYWGDPYPCDRDNKELPPTWPDSLGDWECPDTGMYTDTLGQPQTCTQAMSCDFFENEDADMCSFQINLAFDPDVIEIDSVVNGSSLDYYGWNPVQYVIDNEAGTLVIAGFDSLCYDFEYDPPQAYLADVNYHVLPTALPGADAGLDVTYFRYDATEWPYVYYYNGDYEPYDGHPCSLYTDTRTIGEFVVHEVTYTSVSGRVTHAWDSTAGLQAEIFGVGDGGDSVSTVADEEGFYTLDSLIIGESFNLGAWRQGDEGEAISGIDARTILLDLLGVDPLSYEAYVAADTDGDCDVTPLDACLIMQRLVQDSTVRDYFPRSRADSTNWYSYIDTSGDGYGSCIAPTYRLEPVPSLPEDRYFNALLLGDVNGSWLVEPAPATVWCNVDEDTTVADSFYLHFGLNPVADTAEVLSVELELQWDSTSLSFDSVSILDGTNLTSFTFTRTDSIMSRLYVAGAVVYADSSVPLGSIIDVRFAYKPGYGPGDALGAASLVRSRVNEEEYVYGSAPPSCCLLRGDVDHNGIGPDIADLVYLVSFMFQPPSAAPPCEEPESSGYYAECDVNADSVAPDIADLVYLVTYMFQPPAPAPVPCP